MDAMDLGVFGLNYLDDLKIPLDDYVIGASGAMVAHRLMDKNDDLDLLVKPDAMARLVSERKLKLVTKKSFSNVYLLSFTDKSGKIDANESMRFILSIPTDYWFEESVVINGHRYSSIRALKVQYELLYEKYHLPKHKIKVDILNRAI